MAMLHKRQAPGRDIHKHFSLAPARQFHRREAGRGGLELADRGDLFWYLKFDPSRGLSDLFCPVQAQTRPDQGRESAREARNPSNQRAGFYL